MSRLTLRSVSVLLLTRDTDTRYQPSLRYAVCFSLDTDHVTRFMIHQSDSNSNNNLQRQIRIVLVSNRTNTKAKCSDGEYQHKQTSFKQWMKSWGKSGNKKSGSYTDRNILSRIQQERLGIRKCQKTVQVTINIEPSARHPPTLRTIEVRNVKEKENEVKKKLLECYLLH